MKKGFVFIETIIVICVLSITLMSLYGNYSKILTNTRQFNTFDTAEYNYKTYFISRMSNLFSKLSENSCYTFVELKSFDGKGEDDILEKVCLLINVTERTNGVKGYINEQSSELDAYIIDYLLAQDFNKNNDSLFLVKFKKKDKQSDEYFTYISSMTY